MKLKIEQSPENEEVEITVKCGMVDEKLERLIAQIRLYAFSITGKKAGGVIRWHCRIFTILNP